MRVFFFPFRCLVSETDNKIKPPPRAVQRGRRSNKHQEELNKHWKSLKSTALSKCTFTFCSNGSEQGPAGEAPALRWEHEDVLFWFAFILLSYFFFQEEKIAMATCATAELLGEWLQVRLATHQLTMLICQIYIVINVKRQSTI